MEIMTTIELISESREEIKKDKEYYLKCYRLMRAIKNINKISAFIALGRLYPDERCCAVVYGFCWR